MPIPGSPTELPKCPPRGAPKRRQGTFQSKPPRPSFPAGDTFSVYPAQDGTAYESLRLVVFHEALEDVRTMKLCETYYGRERVVAEMEAVLGRPITFAECAVSAAEVLSVRARVDELIAEAIGH